VSVTPQRGVFRVHQGADGNRCLGSGMAPASTDGHSPPAHSEQRAETASAPTPPASEPIATGGPASTSVHGPLRILAVLHLALAVLVTLGVLISSPDHLSAISIESTYGGDAYTGIQNAAADTEASIVRAANQQMDDMHDTKVLLSLLFLGAGLIHITIAFRRATNATTSVG
jgi:hypothetical protein